MLVFVSCSTYSPVVHGSGRWWLDLVLSLLFAADYLHRTLVSNTDCTESAHTATDGSSSCLASGNAGVGSLFGPPGPASVSSSRVMCVDIQRSGLARHFARRRAVSPMPVHYGVLQTSSRHPLLAALHPLALIDVLSFAPSLLGVLLPEYTVAPWGWDLRWFRVFR